MIKVKNSVIHGKGLFASRPIREGQWLGKCMIRHGAKKVGPYSLWDQSGETFVEVMCRLRFINHSKEPNVEYQDDLSVIALRDIRPGEELTHDYGDDWE